MNGEKAGREPACEGRARRALVGRGLAWRRVRRGVHAQLGQRSGEPAGGVTRARRRSRIVRDDPRYQSRETNHEVAARAANNNALPPDLALMTKALHDGAAYIHSLLTGYQEQPAELLKKFPDSKTGVGLHYNPYFANLNIAMPPPLVAEGQVTYADGTKATVDQMAQDVAAFLVWTAEPKLENRHRTGVAVLIFLLIATTLGFLAYRNVWSGVKH